MFCVPCTILECVRRIPLGVMPDIGEASAADALAIAIELDVVACAAECDVGA